MSSLIGWRLVLTGCIPLQERNNLPEWRDLVQLLNRMSAFTSVTTLLKVTSEHYPLFLEVYALLLHDVFNYYQLQLEHLHILQSNVE